VLSELPNHHSASSEIRPALEIVALLAIRGTKTPLASQACAILRLTAVSEEYKIENLGDLARSLNALSQDMVPTTQHKTLNIPERESVYISGRFQSLAFIDQLQLLSASDDTRTIRYADTWHMYFSDLLKRCGTALSRKIWRVP